MPRPPRTPLDDLQDFLLDQARQGIKTIFDKAKQQPSPFNQPMPGFAYPQQPVQPAPTPQKRSRTARQPKGAPTTHYDTLEVSPAASQETITAAFRSLSQRFHPDNLETGNGDRYRAVTEAYAALKNPTKRTAYDRKAGF